MRRYLKNTYTKQYDIIISAGVQSPSAQSGTLGHEVADLLNCTPALLIMGGLGDG